jgi:preprotein translocase subunit Sss1
MMRKAITPEFILTTILDALLGIILLGGIGYVATLCLAPAG